MTPPTRNAIRIIASEELQKPFFVADDTAGAAPATRNGGVLYPAGCVLPTPFTSTLTRTGTFGPSCDV